MSILNYEEILTKAEAARFLRIDEKTLQSLCKDGEVPWAKIGKQYRFSKKALLAFIEEQMYRSILEKGDKDDI